MIIDCFTHTWKSDQQLGLCADAWCAPAAGEGELGAVPGAAQHVAAAEPVEKTVVLGFKSRYLNAHIPNQQVAAYVAQHADRMVGFAGIDPSEPREAIAELRVARDELSMPGAAVAPAAQDFHPTDSQAMLVYAEAAELGMPIMFHTGVRLSSATKLEYARPLQLDEVAREYPGLKIIVAHMGFPWVDETVVLLSKHRNVYAEISRVVHRSWQAYQALHTAYDFGVMDKLLFGSGFPDATPAQTIEALFGLNHLVHGTNLPAVPREKLRGIVERDALALLGIDHTRRTVTPSPARAE